MEIQEKIEWVYSQDKLFAVGALKKNHLWVESSSSGSILFG